MLRSIGLIILSGALLVAAFPNLDASILAWFAFVPFFFVISASSHSRSFAYSYLAGIIFFAGILYWLTYVTKLGYILFILFLALFFGIFGFVAGIFFRKFKNSPLAFMLCLIIPSLWVSIEFLRGFILTGFPWCLLGHSQYRHLLLIQIADITGAYGVSFLIMMGNFVIYSIINAIFDKKGPIPKLETAIFIAFFAVSVFYGYFRLSAEKNGDEIRISVVQGGIQQSEKWDPSYREYIMGIYETLTKEAASDEADLVVWPETAIPGFVDEWDIALWLERIEVPASMPLFSGAVTYEQDKTGDHFFNSAVLFAEDKSIRRKYDKIHLVPFGEYIPFEAHIPFFRGSINTEIGNYTAGKEFTIFELTSESGNKYRYGALICFEDIFPELARGFASERADFLINITNDAWFRESSEQFQHAQASVFRAVENRLSVIRAANNGFSCYINPKGVIEDYIGKDGGSISQKGRKTFHVEIAKKRGIYTTYGDIFIYACLTFLITCYLVDFLRLRI